MKVKGWFAAVLFIAACSGGAERDVERMTCELITGDNCWTDALRAIEPCVPADRNGQLDEAGESCSLAGGAAVSFQRNAYESSPDWDFELTSGAGAQCFHFVGDSGATARGGRWTLKTAEGVVAYEVGDQVRLACPDGRTFEMDYDEWLVCGTADMPGLRSGWSADDQHLIFGLAGGGVEVDVFDCER